MRYQLLSVIVTWMLLIAATEPSTAPVEKPLTDNDIAEIINRAEVERDIAPIERMFRQLTTTLKQSDPQQYVSDCMKMSQALTTFNFKGSKKLQTASAIALAGLENVDTKTSIVCQIELATRLRYDPAAPATEGSDTSRGHYMELWTGVMQRVNMLAAEPVGDQPPINSVPAGFEQDVPIIGGDSSVIADPKRREEYENALGKLTEHVRRRNEIIYAKTNSARVATAYIGFVNAAYAGKLAGEARLEVDRYLKESLISETDRGRAK
jgi:hypothetical protein